MMVWALMTPCCESPAESSASARCFRSVILLRIALRPGAFLHVLQDLIEAHDGVGLDDALLREPGGEQRLGQVFQICNPSPDRAPARCLSPCPSGSDRGS